jgi:hypothetical protein
MAEGRPAIPTELKRRILVEAGHRCAIPTCRATQVEIAHIDPWNKVKEHRYENLIALCPNCHNRFDRGEIDKKSVLQYKAQLRFVIERYSRFELDVLEELSSVGRAIPFPEYLLLLVKHLKDEELVSFQHNSRLSIQFGGVRVEPGELDITEKGRNFMADFKLGKDIGYSFTPEA